MPLVSAFVWLMEDCRCLYMLLFVLCVIRESYMLLLVAFSLEKGKAYIWLPVISSIEDNNKLPPIRSLDISYICLLFVCVSDRSYMFLLLVYSLDKSYVCLLFVCVSDRSYMCLLLVCVLDKSHARMSEEISYMNGVNVSSLLTFESDIDIEPAIPPT